MLRKEIALFVIALLYSVVLYAQQDSSFLIKGSITIADTRKALPLVNIFNMTSQQGTTSNELGAFELQINTWPALLQFTYVGYEPYAIWINQPTNEWLNIQLQPYYANLPDVVISAKPIIETITQPTYTVRDYVFVGDKILMATLPGMRAGNSLVLIDEDGKALDSISIKHIRHFDFLHKSCLGEIHLVTSTEHYEIVIDSNRVHFVGMGKRKEFSREIEPCVAATDSLMIYRFRYCIGQLLRFTAFGKDGTKEFLFAEVANDANLKRRYREELAFSIGYIDYLNVSWEEKQLELKRAIVNNMQLAGLIHLFYKPINIPLLQIGEQLHLFNYLEDQIQVFNEKGTGIGAIPITYQKEKKWDGDVIQDKVTGNVYTLFDHPKGKLLRQINMLDGTLGQPVLIDCAMVEGIKVNNGKVFYLESGRGLEEYNRVLRKVKL